MFNQCWHQPVLAAAPVASSSGSGVEEHMLQRIASADPLIGRPAVCACVRACMRTCLACGLMSLCICVHILACMRACTNCRKSHVRTRAQHAHMRADRQMHGRLDGYTAAGGTDGRKDGCTASQPASAASPTVGRMRGRACGRTNRSIVGGLDGRADAWRNARMDGRAGGRKHGRTD